MTDKNDSRELLAWYASGTLAPEERASVERLLAESPAARAELEWLRALKRDLPATLAIPAGDLGQARLMQRIALERAGPNVVALPRRPERPRWFAPAFALAASMLLAQAAVIGFLVHERDASLAPLSGPPPGSGDLLQVTFKPDATERDIRGLLASVEAELVGGPGALGVYTVRVPAGRADGAAGRLSGRADLVESVARR
jgi:anti-sigma factor RsiW